MVRELVVDDDEPFGRDEQRNVTGLVIEPVVGPARLTPVRRAGQERPANDVEIILDGLNAHRAGLEDLGDMHEGRLGGQIALV